MKGVIDGHPRQNKISSQKQNKMWMPTTFPRWEVSFMSLLWLQNLQYQLIPALCSGSECTCPLSHTGVKGPEKSGHILNSR